MIPEPAYNLGVGSGHHGHQTAEMLRAIEQLLLAERPDCVVVYGDTNSTLAGALATTKLKIPLAHVEAGLRSFNRQMPEEINRVLTDHSSDFLFAPTANAVDNLRREGIAEGVHLVGDVMYDAVLQYASMADAKSHILQRLSLTTKQYVLATIHRAENTDSSGRLQAILDAFGQIAHTIPVIFPVHPRTRHAACRLGVLLTPSGLQLINPVGYLDMMMLEKHALVIVTDSGGVQKEAFFHRVPCVTLRCETEWIELLASGWNRLVPPLNSETIMAGIEDAIAAAAPSSVTHLYGGGRSAEQIVGILLNGCMTLHKMAQSSTSSKQKV